MGCRTDVRYPEPLNRREAQGRSPFPLLGGCMDWKYPVAKGKAGLTRWERASRRTQVIGTTFTPNPTESP